jgi:hypothetical protein
MAHRISINNAYLLSNTSFYDRAINPEFNRSKNRPALMLAAAPVILYFVIVIFSSSAHLDYAHLIPQPLYASESGNDHKSTETEGIPRLASGLPLEQLCVECLSSKNVISGQGLVVGTNFVDYMVGSTFNDIIFSKDGSDVVFLDLGTDRFYGGSKDDTVEGGPGNDQIFGEDGDDNLLGSFDDDLLVAGSGNDHMFGDIGNDVLVGGPGSDYFSCGDGMDIVMNFDLSDVHSGDCELFA